ncbi:MAG: response regulator [Candidatus Sulfotelmatobacter sp.]
MNNASKPSPVRVLIVDDSAFMRAALSRIVGSDAALEVVGTAASGHEALRQVPALNPDVITLDVQMPGMDGVETLRRIMLEFPRPVIMVSALTLNDAEITFNALDAGAFDYVPKQLSSTSLDILHLREDLIAKVKAAAESSSTLEPCISIRKPPQPAPPPRHQVSSSASEMVAIGTSTGGQGLCRRFSPHFPRISQCQF